MSFLLSSLSTSTEKWYTSPEYQQHNAQVSLDKFHEVTNLLLENPQFNSTHLFRADILVDSAGTLTTSAEKEQHFQAQPDLSEVSSTSTTIETQNGGQKRSSSLHPPQDDSHLDLRGFPEPPRFDRFTLQRTVIRRLIPRKPQLDKSLEQACYIYERTTGNAANQLVVYVPKVDKEDNMPWYHPPLKALAYLLEGYEAAEHVKSPLHSANARLSIHFLPFSQEPTAVPDRVHRTLLSLLHTFVRLAKHPSDTKSTQAMTSDMSPSSLKDTILPQRLVQDTYSRLKQVYAADLIARWVEKTEPSKHVFEDLSIAAFLIELWKWMYPPPITFPGFIDIACGNGVLVYILLKEGYNGRGFDARRRKTWEMLGIEDSLDESICVPQPFLDVLHSSDNSVEILLEDMAIHNGVFEKDTFVISNHADELTPWTPLLTAMSSSASPLPFLAIPCCSHALSGVKKRYSPKDVLNTVSKKPASVGGDEEEDQPVQGDLKALRAAKAKAANHADDKSMYACLTRKVRALAEEIGFEVELTLMRIPSTRNIGIVGNRKKASMQQRGHKSIEVLSLEDTHLDARVKEIVERECQTLGGVEAAARTWVERARKLQTGQGRGKVNWGGKLESG